MEKAVRASMASEARAQRLARKTSKKTMNACAVPYVYIHNYTCVVTYNIYVACQCQDYGAVADLPTPPL